MTTLEELLRWDESYSLHLSHYSPIVVKGGDGPYLVDWEGRRYLDFSGVAFCTCLGYAHPKLKDAISAQLSQISTALTYLLNERTIRLAKMISEIAPKGLTRSTFYSGGSEAMETAIKVARRATGRQKVITHYGGYHGATLGATSAGGIQQYRGRYEQPLSGFIHVPPPYSPKQDHTRFEGYVEDVVIYEGPDSVAAIIVEPIIAGSVTIPPSNYLSSLRQICDRYEILLIFDEVVTGFGRTGKMFASEHFGVSPDMMTCAKNLCSTYVPCSALVVTDKVAKKLGAVGEERQEYLDRGEMAFTNQNHPLACAAALATIDTLLEDKLVQNSAKMGEYLLGYLNDMSKEFEIIVRPRGRGLLVAIDVVGDSETKAPSPTRTYRIEKVCRELGLLVVATKNRLRPNQASLVFAPPYIIAKEDIEKAMNILTDAIKKTT